MYSWICAPDTLDRGYMHWITRASQNNGTHLNFYRPATEGKPLPIDALEKSLTLPRLTPHNATIITDLLEHSKRGEPTLRFGPCAANHPGFDSCVRHLQWLGPRVAWWMAPVYAGLHFIPPLVFRFKGVRKDPLKFIKRSSIGTLRSSTFLSLYVVIMQMSICALRNAHASPAVSEAFKRIIQHRGIFWLTGSLTSLALLAEDERRRTELGLYCLPKALEAFWGVGKKRGILKEIPHGEKLLMASGMALLMVYLSSYITLLLQLIRFFQQDTYIWHPKSLSGLSRTLVRQFV